MTDRALTISGTISFATSTTYDDTIVELWRWVPLAEQGATVVTQRAQLLGTAIVSADGSFTMDLMERPDDILAVLKGDQRLQDTLVFRVFKGAGEHTPSMSAAGPSGGQSGTWSFDGTTGWSALVDNIPDTPVASHTDKAYGVLYRPSGFTLPGLSVDVVPFDMLSASPPPIASSLTADAAGEFIAPPSSGISTGSDFSSRVKETPSGNHVVSSELVENFSSFARQYIELGWDITGGDLLTPVTRFERIHGALGPLVESGFGGPGTIDLQALDGDQISYVCRRTGVSVDIAAKYFAAQQLMATISSTITPTQLNVEVMFGLLTAGRAASLQSLAAMAATEIGELLTKAGDKRLVSSDLAAQATAIDSELNAVGEAELTAAPPATPSKETTSLLEVAKAGSGTATSTDVTQLLANIRNWDPHAPTPIDVWSGVSAGVAQEVQLRVLTSAMCLRQMAVVDAIFSAHTTVLAFPADLLKLTDAELQAAYSSLSVVDDFPTGLEGDTVPELQASYLSAMREKLEDEFPSAHFLATLSRDPDTSWNTLWTNELVHAKAIFDPTSTTTNLPTNGSDEGGTPVAPFNLGTDHIASRFDGTPGVDQIDLVGLSLTQQQKDDLQAFLEAVQRIYRVAPARNRFATVKAVMGQGYSSAWSIQSLSQKAWVDKIEAALGGDKVTARQVHVRARRQAMAALAAFSSLDTGMQGPPVAMVPDFRKALLATSSGGAVNTGDLAAVNNGEIPGYEDIFGSADYCEPHHAESVLGPAAYLVDLFKFLEGIEGTSPATAYSELTKSSRRPDLVDVVLNRHNTETTLPIIDLVLELLVDRVASPTPSPILGETGGSSAERRAVPEPDLSGADTVLKTAVWPLTLPYDRPADAAGTLLGHLGLSPADVVHGYRTPGTSARYHEEQWTLDRAKERRAIPDTLWDTISFWDTVSPDASDLADLNARWGDPTNTGTFQKTAGDEFVGQLGLEADDLYTLQRSSEFEQPGTTGAPYFAFGVTPGADPCIFSDLTVVSTGSGTINDVAAVALAITRVARHFGWELLETARVLTSLDAWTGTSPRLFPHHGDSHQDLRVALDLIAELTSSSELSPREVAALWGELDRQDGRTDQPEDVSLYKELFAPASLDAATRLTMLNLATSSPGNFGSSTVDSVIMTGLNVDRATYDELLSAMALTGTVVNQADIGVLYRWRVLAELSGLDIDTVLALAQLKTSGGSVTDLFNAASKWRIMEFLEQLQQLSDSPLSTDQARWVLDGTDSEAAVSLQMTDEQVDLQLQALWTALWAAESDTTDSPRAALFSAHVAEIWGVDVSLVPVVSQAVVGLDASAPSTSAEAWFCDPAGTGTFLGTDATVEPLSNLSNPSTELDVSRAFWRRMSRILAVLSPWKLVEDDYTELFDSGSAIVTNVLDLLTLPADASGPSAAFDGLCDLLQILARRNQFVDPTATLKSVQAASPLAEAVATAMEWPTGTVSTPTTGPIIAQWRWAEDTFGVANKLGLKPALIEGWASPISTGGLGTLEADIRNAAQSRHTPQNWWDIVTPLQDHLRERHRDALMAYLIGDGTYADESAAYADLLIDPLYRADQLTSRLKQAITSVQLFAHRCLLGLENFTLDPESEEQWAWTKNYRVWEAARKVYLWPENWIEPDLRLDGTSLFDDVRNAVQHLDLSEDQIRDAYGSYLGQLADQGSLKILGFVHQQETDEDGHVDELHVFARAAGIPARGFDHDHYDVPAERIDALVAMGAQRVPPKELVRRLIASGLRVKERDRR